MKIRDKLKNKKLIASKYHREIVSVLHLLDPNRYFI